MTKARDLSKLLSTSNGKIAGENLDVSFENITDTGTEGTKVASGTTAERGSTAGQIRFNSTTGLAEYYTGTAFKSIDSPPTVSSLDVTEVDSQAGGNQTIVITGSNFASGATVTFVGSSGTDFNASTVTVDSATQITVVAPKVSFLNAQEPYGVKVENTSGLSATLSGQINVDTSPSWSTASGSLGTVFDSTRGTASFTVSATDTDGDTIAYSLQSGSLPAGASLNSSTGAITGFSAVGSDTTSSFTLRATAGGKTADRAFSIVVNAPIEQAFTYTGSNQTFTVPSGVTSVTAHVFGAGGGGGHLSGWQDQSPGGAGGSAVGDIDVSSLSSLLIVVGQGGEGNDGVGSTPIRSAFGGGGGGTTTSDNAYGGGGGGLSGIFNGSYTHGNSILIAGGGGGGGAMNGTTGYLKSRGGAGGGTTGEDGASVDTQYRGRGGTQSAGGASPANGYNHGGTDSGTGIAGSALQGGGDTDGYSYGGKGGGGYYGGSEGSYNEPGDMAGGGGGSGYYDTTLVSSATLYAGSGQTPGNSSSSYRNGSGNGGNPQTDGGNGRIVLVY